MIVNLERRGASVIGLRIGAENARQHFPTENKCIHLELGEIGITCRLDPEFWRDQPSILDSRLSEWLEAKRQQRSSGNGDIVVALTPVRRDAYRLNVLPGPSKTARRFDA